VWFSRYITKKVCVLKSTHLSEMTRSLFIHQRNEHKRVSESTFYSLAQYFAIVLFECAEADHFVPAKSLMNMCFTFYHQPSRSRAAISAITDAIQEQYLYSVLRDQPIWRSLRFWNAAFFDAVQSERVTFFEKGHAAHSPQDILEDWQFQANATFGQLGFVNKSLPFSTQLIFLCSTTIALLPTTCIHLDCPRVFVSSS